MQCSNENFINSQKEISCPTTILHFNKNGFKDMESSLRNYISMKIYDCALCDGLISSKKVLKNHLFIETDMYEEEKLFKLLEFTPELKIDDEK